MCYSALVNQNAKNLSLTYQARIQPDLFEELFRARLEGSGAKIPRAMEAAFLEAPQSAAELRIAKAIREFHELEATNLRSELAVQVKRLASAELTLAGKTTKKAQNEQRIATEKIERIERRLTQLDSGGISEADSRIYPGMYAPLILQEAGKRTIRPFRYLLRPRGQPADFDRNFNGSYNARRDRLREVKWWKTLYGENHAILVIRAFYENVKLHEKNRVLRFEPQSPGEMIVPCIWDRNESDSWPLENFALITDEPNPEVAAAGHDRTPIILKEKYFDTWLTPGNGDYARYETAFDDKQPTYFRHSVAA